MAAALASQWANVGCRERCSSPDTRGPRPLAAPGDGHLSVTRRPDEKRIRGRPSACARGLPSRNVAADGSVGTAPDDDGGGGGGRLRVDAART